MNKTKKLEPVKLEMVIDDCGECPFIEEDESYAGCMYKDGPKLPIYRRVGHVRTPPKDCPLRREKVR